MMLKTSVKILKDPQNKQPRLNEHLAKYGAEAPELNNQTQIGEPSSQTRTLLPEANIPSEPTVVQQGATNPAIAASQGVPALIQPRGCRVVIHQPVAMRQLAPGVVEHVTAPSQVNPAPIPVVPPLPDEPAAKPKRKRKKAPKETTTKALGAGSGAAAAVAELTKKSKAALVALAKKANVSHSGSKAAIAKRLVSALKK